MSLEGDMDIEIYVGVNGSSTVTFLLPLLQMRATASQNNYVAFKQSARICTTNYHSIFTTH